MKAKKNIVIVGVLILVLLVIGLMVRSKMSEPPEKEAEVLPTPTEALPTVSPDINIDLTPRFDKKAVVLKVKGIPEDVSSMEYELTYDTSSGLPRGVLGKIDLEGENSLARDITLGTCSRGKCVYDQGVTTVSLSLKFNSSIGSSVFQKDYTL